MKKHLSEEEKEILDDFEKNDWIPVEDLSARQKELKNYAQNTLKKSRKLSIKISEKDLNNLQIKAVREGIPYQTYVSSIIHKFLNGHLVEV